MADLIFHNTSDVCSWSRLGTRNHAVARPRFVGEPDWSTKSERAYLAIGSRRSYSDVCLADGGRLIDMTGLDRFRTFDPSTGILVAEAGVTLDDILTTFVPLGFFPPVTPGTRFVTLGGAIANDVHGKNHQRAGTFGCHVMSFVLERSDAGRISVTRESHPDLFAATVGGLGLTGIITEVKLRLQRIASTNVEVETVACENLDALCDGLSAGDSAFEHNVAWVDCTAGGPRVGRGLLTRANWHPGGPLEAHRAPRFVVPTDRVTGLLNPLTLRLFNTCYQGVGRLNAGTSVRHYEQFFYPLDNVLHWNRLYGRRGFYQYQCVIPDAAGREPIRAVLAEIASSGEGSFLAVLKQFGAIASPGLLSFPRPGLTLALDFRNRGSKTLALLARLDRIVEAADGRLYPAKDMRMPPRLLRAGYPALERFERELDPACISEFRKKMIG